MIADLTRYTLLIMATALLSVGCASDDDTESSTERITPIAGYEVQPRDMSRVVRASAVVEPENTVTIASRMSGLITQLHVREGDRIPAGDVMIELDVEEQQAELERARAEGELAEARYRRAAQLLEREAVSASEYDEALANRNVARSEVKLLETRAGFGTIRATSDVVILRRYVEQGDAVTLNEPLLRVADLGRLVVRAGISERDVVHLEEGRHVDIRIDAWPDEAFEGAISRIYPAADEESRLITVEISLPAEQQDRLIRPGYLARVTMDAERRRDVIAVPSESLLASERDERFVYVINDENRLVRRDVETGIERRNWTQIRSGLEPGDVVVGANPSNLREDIRVEVTRWVSEDTPGMATRR